jgi:hypothetical protein
VTFKRLLMIGMMVVCLAALPVMAQEGEGAAQSSERTGVGTPITTLVILSGLVAVLVVGGWIYYRENAKDGKEVD